MQQQGDLRLRDDRGQLEAKIDSVLSAVTKPNQYVGNELNLPGKNHSEVKIRFALAYPDTYFIGMSHLGLKILYHILNRRSDALAERVYAPWVDMESQMRKRGIPLFSLESRMAIREFDVLGFTLQHELNFTNVLNMLDLAGIPLHTKDRQGDVPLVLAGGSCASNPEPLADFIDAFVIGDGEEVIEEIADLLIEGKKEGWKRHQTLIRLADLEGIYVPSLYRPEYGPDGRFQSLMPLHAAAAPRITARIIERLELENYPLKPLVPLTEIAHDRLSIEIMRGCTQGCRYCHAGMVYRPVREKAPQDILREVICGIDHGGWEEVSLLSLSSSDYSCLLPLISELNFLLQDRCVALSLPSLRPDTFSEKLAQSLKDVRRTGLTFAPESGTSRLRKVINKDFQEEDLLQTLRIAFDNGWESVKLYFMIGLPTESWDDLNGIVELGRKVRQLVRKKRRRELHVSISPFTPKPHTPFQWEKQDSVDLLEKKSRYLKSRLPHSGLRVTWRDPRISFLEGVFARGDRRLGSALEAAWLSGCTFDSWTERFDFSRWEAAFLQAQLDPRVYIDGRSLENPLPWDHISYGVTRSYLERERDRAFQGQLTPDCRSAGCHGCGAHRGEARWEPARWSSASRNVNTTPAYGRSRKRRDRERSQVAKTRVRVHYTKEEPLQYISHLDLIRLIERAVRRTGLPIAYTEGFHPHPKIAFGPPLPLGLTSLAEYMDLQFDKPRHDDLTSRLGPVLPQGIRILAWKGIFQKTESLSSAITVAEYRVDVSGVDGRSDISPGVQAALAAEHLIVRRVTPKKSQTVDVRPSLLDLRLESRQGENVVFMRLRMGAGASARPQEVLSAVLDMPQEELLGIPVQRTAQFIETDGRLFSPLEAV